MLTRACISVGRELRIVIIYVKNVVDGYGDGYSAGYGGGYGADSGYGGGKKQSCLVSNAAT